ncbi:MAG: flagellar export chaperone FliS [Acidobacteria bacterium]|nr:flagellar export chaperone FliS [Acidobacteriota bacterium]
MTSPRTAYRENDVRGATSDRLVVLLYDQIILDLVQAAHAIEREDVERRTKMLNHAILVIAHLQSPLDFANGGKVAKDLDHFYNVLRHNLLQVQFYPSLQGIRQQITDVQVLREAWIEVERSKEPEPHLATKAAAAGATSSSPAAGTTHRRVDWEG